MDNYFDRSNQTDTQDKFPPQVPEPPRFVNLESNIMPDIALPPVKKSKAPPVLILILGILLAAVAVYAGIQTFHSMNYHKIAMKNKSLYSEQVRLVQQKENELDTISAENSELKTELSKTEAGRKSLEAIADKLKDENTELDQRATKAEEQLKEIQKELDTKKAELGKVNQDLAVKRAEIEKAERGVVIFKQTEEYINTFQKANADYISNIDSSIDQINRYMATIDESYLDLANDYLRNATDLFAVMDETSEKIEDNFNTIKSGKY